MTDTITVRTRFAPSPTGYLHIGGVRTALFGWLFARAHGGQFVLRIDDTDQQRNVDEALRPILDGLRWLGIDWDEGPDVGGPHEPYYQSRRGERYRAAAEALVASGHAYRDYATTEEIQAEREAAQQAKRQFRYSRRWMAETPADDERFRGEGREAVIRLKMPSEGKLVVDDLVRGRVEFDWASEQDHVVERADGSPLYHLASVVDDHDFGITHVIRAEEHLSNTPRQIFIVESLGYPRPDYAHLPYVAEPGSKNKLSKRKLEKYLKNAGFAKLMAHGKTIASRMGRSVNADTFNPVIVDFYREVGYLPEAIVNYLLLLGWSLDDKAEYFDRAEMIEHFSLSRVNKAPASFDPQKLTAFQQHYMQQLPVERVTELVQPYAVEAGLVASPPSDDEREKLGQIVAAAGDRIAVAGDVLDYAHFFQADDALVYDEKAFEKRIRKPDDAADILRGFAAELAAATSIDVASLDKLLHDYVERREINIGQIIHALRVATTGQAVGFGMFETLAILGREHTCARIDRTLSLI
jgi:glutamyl-tRNA synthetase